MSESLKNNEQFKNVYTNGKSFANKYLIMYLLENNLQFNRLGISVSKKVGNSVVRHRVTRLIRESFRLNNHKLKVGYDIVIVARVLSKDKKYNDIGSAFIHLCKIHKILL